MDYEYYYAFPDEISIDEIDKIYHDEADREYDMLQEHGIYAPTAEELLERLSFSWLPREVALRKCAKYVARARAQGRYRPQAAIYFQ